jgi:hypothetical protein
MIRNARVLRKTSRLLSTKEDRPGRRHAFHHKLFIRPHAAEQLPG